jgi:predicted component of type VI protein secretion system
MTLKLFVAKSGSGGPPPSEHVFTGDAVTLGRVAGNDVILPDTDKRVSGKHARLDKRDGAWQLTDVGSTNGTYLNDKKVEAKKPYGIKGGDRLSLGLFQIRIEIEVQGDFSPTLKPVDPTGVGAKLAERASLEYARRLGEAPEARSEAVRAILKSGLEGLSPEQAKGVIAEVKARFESEGEAAGGGGARPKVESGGGGGELGGRQLQELAAHYLGDVKFENAEQVQKFCKLVEQAVDLTLEWVSNCLKGRREFENQFNADLTLVFAKGGNPIKSAGSPKDIGRWLLDFRSKRDLDQSRQQLENAFKDLTMHQLGLLAGVQECLKALLGKLEPKIIEQEALAQAKGFSGMMAKLNVAKKAWETYTEKHKEMFEENSKLFNELIYPNIRKGYLASHAEDGPGAAQPAEQL